MEFRQKDPGAVQFGNFINYYQFNSAEERLKLLPSNHWQEDGDLQCSDPYLVLDVGCNTGVFTKLLREYLSGLLPQRAIHIFGIDIDPALILRAKADEESQGKGISFDCVDIMDTEAFGKILNFLSNHKRTQFDAVCCFSITMWIHLNHHDLGLQEFLRKLSVIAKLFIVEPQPWKCYQTAERRLKKSGDVFPLFLQLKWRSNVENEIQNYLEATLQRTKVYESVPTKWQRKICFYR